MHIHMFGGHTVLKQNHRFGDEQTLAPQEREEVKAEADDDDDDTPILNFGFLRAIPSCNERWSLEEDYLQQIDNLEETGATLREAWAKILVSLQQLITELRRKLEVRRLERDELRRRLREEGEKGSAEISDIITRLSAAKLEAAELALETDQIALRLRQSARASTQAAKPLHR